MKLFTVIALAVSVVACSAEASGKLGLGVTYTPKTEEAAPVVGLSISQKLFGPLYYSQWSGLGCDAENVHGDFCNSKWIGTKHGLDLYVKGVQLGAWVGVNADPKDFKNSLQPQVGAKIALELWK